MVTNHDGTVLTTHDFLAYGEELTDPDFSTNNMKYTGHERDPETGLDYMKARYYASGPARMLQVDPIDDYDFTDPMSFNKYSYVRGNPVKYLDIEGTNVYLFFWRTNDTRTGAGHVAIGVGTRDNLVLFEANPSKSAIVAPMDPKYKIRGDIPRVSTVSTINHGRSALPVVIEFKTSKDQDKGATKALEDWFDKYKNWDLGNADCADAAKAGLQGAGLDGGSEFLVSTPKGLAKDLLDNSKKQVFTNLNGSLVSFVKNSNGSLIGMLVGDGGPVSVEQKKAMLRAGHQLRERLKHQP